MSDGGQRPRPQYGEYATPEEQRAAIKSPQLNPHYAPPEHPHHSEGGVASQDAPPAAPDRRDAAPGDRAAPVTRRHPLDRIATIALLVLGLYDVIGSFAGNNGVITQIDVIYRSLGISGEYKPTDLTDTVAGVIAVVFLVLWIAAAGLSAWAVLRGRIAFWIPLAAGVLAAVVSAVGGIILTLHDPAYLQFLNKYN
jgi:hypothetical protein